VFHQYVVRSRERDGMKAFLQRRGIGSLVHYPSPVHLQPAYLGRLPHGPGGLEETEKAAREVLSLPMYPQLAGPQLDQVCDTILEWAAKAN
jgi:hypothetical protein